ncbi:MAG: hypothetical protein QW717_04180 [Candidatus Bathyarchaeia archaeon]
MKPAITLKSERYAEKDFRGCMPRLGSCRLYLTEFAVVLAKFKGLNFTICVAAIMIA